MHCSAAVPVGLPERLLAFVTLEVTVPPDTVTIVTFWFNQEFAPVKPDNVNGSPITRFVEFGVPVVGNVNVAVALPIPDTAVTVTLFGNIIGCIVAVPVGVPERLLAFVTFAVTVPPDIVAITMVWLSHEFAPIKPDNVNGSPTTRFVEFGVPVVGNVNVAVALPVPDTAVTVTLFENTIAGWPAATSV
jgi:hypothetical protein